jgi:hypothetical protein
MVDTCKRLHCDGASHQRRQGRMAFAGVDYYLLMALVPTAHEIGALLWD